MSSSIPLDIDALLAPLDGKQPAGIYDEEEETFQAIEHEMVKLGGLHASTIDWAYVDEASRQYLCSQSKHFRIAGHLIVARLRCRTWGGWADAAALLAGMIERFWESGYPKPGATGLPAKRKLVTLQLDRLVDALSGLDPASFAQQWRDTGLQALDSLQANAGMARLDEPTLTRLVGQFRRRVEEMRSPDQGRESAPIAFKTERAAISEEFFGTAAGSHGNERENRRSLLTMAEIINRQDAYDPTGYLLRRFALWAHLNSAPSASKGSRTELMAVPVDIVEGYQEALASNALTPVLLQRVEKSVTSSPYWIRGSFLSATIAERLEMPQVAEAIRLRTEHFLLRLPALLDLQFGDGRPFVDSDVQEWVSGAGCPGSAPSMVTNDFSVLRDELAARLDAGVEPFLQLLEQMQAQAPSSMRERCHTMTIAADLLHARGHSWLATNLYAAAHQIIDRAELALWEPELYNHLAKQTAS
ncbi:type VI secretion system protein TssA [Burkholderia sola]|uniref:type VI secretion system protein TssA n=1 Tax=Burkholderia TaxID=32008 RepID=UPI001AE48A79|nr:type VI secretion system protein TssA [Burkholderia sp. AcTa6-5]